MWLPTLFFGFLVFTQKLTKVDFFKLRSVGLFLIPTIPLGVYLTQNITTSHDHYLMPVVGIFLFFFALSLKFVNEHNNFFERSTNKDKIFKTVFVFSTIAIAFGLNTFFKYVTNYITEQNQSKLVYEVALSYLKKNKAVYFSPYTPVPVYFEEPHVNYGLVFANWNANQERIDGSNVGTIVINKDAVEGFITKWDHPYFLGITGSLEQGKKNRDFFAKYRSSSNANSPWVATYEDNKYLVWEKNKLKIF